jgi:signal transduction histidine kinase
MAQHELRPRARLELDLRPTPPVLASPVRLSQVFLNLIVNAAQAIPEGAPERHRVRIAAALAPDGRARVEISDTGAGIAPADLGRIFDPFFTTKGVGEGTGLGLSVSQGIVAALGGTITCTSAPGEGTTFTVLLPAAAEGAGRAPPPPAPPDVAAAAGSR